MLRRPSGSRRNKSPVPPSGPPLRPFTTRRHLNFYALSVSQYDRFCPLKLFDTAHFPHFGSTSPPSIFLWHHHCIVMMSFFICLLICVKNVMHMVLVSLNQCNFCCLLRFIIISSVHGAFSLFINVHVHSIGTKKFLLRKF